jgi:hypothetical protein
LFSDPAWGSAGNLGRNRFYGPGVNNWDMLLQKTLSRAGQPAIPCRELQLVHAMSGVILIDRDEKRLARLSATLTQQVDFGYGVIGHLRKGGTVDVNRIRLAPGIWKTSSFRIDINGRFVFFKTLNKQQDEAHSDFKSVAPDTTILQALQQIGGK